MLYAWLVVLRTLIGHKANICSVDFHPFGEYLASGSVDTDIKVAHKNTHKRLINFCIVSYCLVVPYSYGM